MTEYLPTPSLSLPSGTLTFLFTDIQGSTRLWEQHPDAMRQAMVRHDALIESAVAEYEGTIVRPRGEGDSRFAVFPRASNAVLAAAAIQRAFFGEDWPTTTPLRVRMALHTGEADLRDGDYYGTAVNRCARLRSAAHGGQTLISQVTYDLVRNLLVPGISTRDLGKHRLKDLKSSEHIYQLVAKELPSEFPPLETLAFPETNLPIQLTNFIGREKEIARVRQMLSTTRLLTLLGPGGSGKTRLALQAAAEEIGTFSHGVWLVELASLSDSQLVSETVLSVLGLREPNVRPPVDTLTNHLRTKKVLLILDNCEHLIEATAQLAQALLSACPDLTILATSREAMDIAGECTFRVPALAVPDLSSLASEADPVSHVATYEAVQLFLDRAVAVQPDLHLTRENVAAVADICRRLDGIPLAIELAAARVNTLSVGQIAARLDDRFRLLTGGSRIALPRHQRLRACFDWSYDLLSEPERILLRRLSVFAGGWCLRAAEQVCAGDGITSEDILDLYNHLVNKSLVIATVYSHETRARLLETIRRYALERLVESGEAERVRRRHLQHYMALAEEAGSKLKTDEQLAALRLLESERDNLRAALDWANRGDDLEPGWRLAGALTWFWSVRGYLNEGRELLERMLTQEVDASLSPSAKLARAKVMYSAAYLAWRQGAYDRAAALSAQSKVICEEMGDRLGLAWSLYNQGLVEQFQGDYDRAVATFQQGLVHFQEVDNTWGTALSLDSLGDVLGSHGEHDRAAKALQESLTLFRKTGDRWGIAHVLCNSGVTESFMGTPERATALLEESLALYRELGDKAGAAYALDNLGNVARARGDNARAAALIQEGLNLRRELGNQRGVAASLGHLGKVEMTQGKPERASGLYKEGLNLASTLGDRLGIAVLFGSLGQLATRQGQYTRAARLFGAADSLRRVIGAPLPPAGHAEFARDLDCVRSAAGAAEFDRAWNAGRTNPLDQAIAYALDGTEENHPETILEPARSSSALGYSYRGR